MKYRHACARAINIPLRGFDEHARYNPPMPRRAAIVSALRTPVGRYAGALATVRPDDLAAQCIGAVVEHSGIDPSVVDDVYLGAANQAGEDNRNVARMSALLAGLPDSVPGSTVNRLCASGLEAVNIAARMIEADHGDVFVAGGVESMSRAPYVLSKAEAAFGRTQEIHDTSIGWRFVNPALSKLHHPYAMGETAENVARDRGISREDQDAFALSSQRKWAEAHESGRFADELLPVDVPQRRGEPIRFETDEHPRPETTIEKLARLRPVFANDDKGTVTAGNSSGVNDGAAALLIVEAERAKSLGLTPIAYVGASASAGVDPAHMGIGPVPDDACAPSCRPGPSNGSRNSAATSPDSRSSSSTRRSWSRLQSRRPSRVTKTTRTFRHWSARSTSASWSTLPSTTPMRTATPAPCVAPTRA